MKSPRGYTYVGLLILLSLIALASTLTVTAGSQLQRRANEEELLFIGAQYASAFRGYSDSTPAGQRPFPSRLEDLLRDPRYPGVKRHLRQIYVDPMTGVREWGLVPAPGGGIMGVHSLSQQTPIKMAGFDAALVAMTDRKGYAAWIFGFYPPELQLLIPGVTVTRVPAITSTAPQALRGETSPASPASGSGKSAPFVPAAPAAPGK